VFHINDHRFQMLLELSAVEYLIWCTMEKS
jgi:hypothetical protein